MAYYKIEAIKCEICKENPSNITLKCDHHICTKCFNKKSLCEICNPICSKCKKTAISRSYQCGHSFCDSCIQPFITKCLICYSMCISCHILKRGINNNYCTNCFGLCNFCAIVNIFDNSLDCKHSQCINCSKKQYSCMICKKTLCNHCAKASTKEKKCKTHHLCRTCNNIF